MVLRRAVSEFPNDNPELHDGLVWACPELRGRALPTLRMRPVAGALPRVIGPSWWLEPEASGDEDEAPAAEIRPPAKVAAPSAEEPASPFARFVATVAGVALNRGATRAAVALTALLTDGRIGQNGVDPSLLAELARRKVLAPGTGQASAELALAIGAWRAVLDGTGGDLSGCGDSTLDAWAAELLAALTNAPRADVAELKRDLRRAGVAAFGLLAVA